MDKFRKAALAIAITAGCFATATAAEAPVSKYILSHAVGFADGQLSLEQEAHLNVIAYQSAVSAVCGGFVVDDAKFSKAFEKLDHIEAASMSEDEKRYHERHLMVVFGVAVGAFLADAASHEGEFCVDAEELRKDADFGHIWQ